MNNNRIAIAGALIGAAAIGTTAADAASVSDSAQPADAPAAGTAPTPPVERPKASNGRTITTREERRRIAAEAHKRGIKLTGTGMLRQAAKPTKRGAIDRNHIEAAQRDEERARAAKQRELDRYKAAQRDEERAATVLTSNTMPGRR